MRVIDFRAAIPWLAERLQSPDRAFASIGRHQAPPEMYSEVDSCKCLSQTGRLTNGIERLWLLKYGGDRVRKLRAQVFLDWLLTLLCNTASAEIVTSCRRSTIRHHVRARWNNCNVAAPAGRRLASPNTASGAVTGLCIDSWQSTFSYRWSYNCMASYFEFYIAGQTRSFMIRPCGSNSMRTCSLVP